MRSRSRFFAVVAGALFSIPTWTLTAVAETSSACMDSQARELRLSGRYEEALQRTTDSLASCRSQRGAPAWKVTEAERLLAYLEKLESMNHGAREDLARADDLQAVHDRTSKAGEFDKALEAVERQLELRQMHLGERHPEVHATLTTLTWTLCRMGNLERCFRLAPGTLELGRALHAGDHPDLARNTDVMAHAKLEDSDIGAARELAQSALEMRKRLFGDENTDVADSLHTLAIVERRDGNSLKGFRLDAEALAMRRRALGPDHLDVSESLWRFGIACRDRGEQGLAEKSLRESVAIRRRLLENDHLMVAEVLTELADNLRWQGDLVEAGEILREVIAIQRPQLGVHPALAQSLEALALVHRMRREFDKAYELFSETVAIRRKIQGDSHPSTLFSHANLALNHVYRGEFEKARRLFAEIRRILAKQPDEGQWGMLPVVLDRYESAAAGLEGDYETAVRFRERAVEAYRKLDRPAELAAVLVQAGGLHVGLGNLAAAEKHFTEAASVYELARKKATPGIKAATFEITPYEHLAMCRLDRGRHPEAWPAVEAARARVLADLLASGDTPASALLRNVPFSLDRVQASLDSRTAIVGWLDSRLTRCISRSWAYVIRNEGPVRWVRLPEAAGLSGLMTKFSAFREALIESVRLTFGGDSPSVMRQARELWTDRFAPLVPHLDGVDELVLIPSWAMGSFPVAALLDGEDRFLGERFRISHAPSASLHAWLRETGTLKARGSITALVVADPPFRPEHLRASVDATPTDQAAAIGPAMLRNALRGDEQAISRLPRLLWSRTEARWVASRFSSSRVLLGKDAGEATLTALMETRGLESFNVLHLATHALIDGEVPERSGLVLSQVELPDPLGVAAGTLNDGVLRGAEIMDGWSLKADLVTLSACETAMGKAIYGEGVVGLAYPFLKAGARSLLVSLWKVDDQATALLMKRFYENWLPDGSAGARPMAKAEALREAQQWLRNYEDKSGQRPFEHPFFWSSFVLLGDPL